MLGGDLTVTENCCFSIILCRNVTIKYDFTELKCMNIKHG